MSKSFYSVFPGVGALFALLVLIAAGMPPKALGQEVSAFAAEKCPDGWEVWKPARGQFLRGSVEAGKKSDHADPDGPRRPGQLQRDQMQRITGSYRIRNRKNGTDATMNHKGAFSAKRIYIKQGPFNSKGKGKSMQVISFDSKKSPNARVSSSTDGETRPTNVAVLYCIKKPGNSDERLKKNFSSLDSVDALKRVMDLQPSYYEWRDKERGEGRQIGLSAQHVMEIFPELVYSEEEWDDKDATHLSIRYEKLAVPLISAVQALGQEQAKLSERGDELLRQRTDLERSNEELEQRVEQLEARVERLF